MAMVAEIAVNQYIDGIQAEAAPMTNTPKPQPRKKPRYFERPDASERPLTFFETMIIVLSAHLGVRTRAQREEDFRRANGLHLFIAAVTYFVLVVSGLIALVSYIAHR
jgi:hypothetical protein